MSAQPQTNGNQEPFALPYFRIAAVSIIFIVIIAFIFNSLAQEFFQSIETARRSSLAQLVRVARNSIEPTVEKIRSGRISRHDGLLEIRNMVRRMVYEDQYGKNYIFMSDYNGTMLVQPYEPNKELTNQWALKDSYGNFIIQELIRTARNHPEGGFVRYHYPPPKSTQPQEKLAFVISIPELNCYIGTGMYLQEFHKEQQSILKWTQYGSIFFVALVALLALISLREILARNNALSAEIQKVVKARKELKAIEEKYRIIFENVVEGIFQSTPEGVFITVNPALAKMCGYASPVEMTTTVSDIARQHYADPFKRDEFMQILAGQGRVDNFEIEVFKKDGSTFWASVNARVVCDEQGEILYFEGTHNDITERRRAQDESTAQHERLIAILDNIPVPTFMIDANRTVIVWNKNNEAYTGKTKQDMLGKPLNLGFLFNDKDVPTLAELLLESTDQEVMEKYFSKGLRRGEALPGAFEIIANISLKDEERILFIQAARIYDKRKNIIGVVQTGQDITERVRLEARLRQAQKMEALGTLAGGVAHDLNNVLGIFVGYSELLLMKLKETDPLRKYALNIFQGGERAAAIIQDLLTMSRRGISSKEVVNLNQIVSDFLKMPEFEVLKSRHEGIEFLVDLDPALLNIKGSIVHFNKTVMNLVLNGAEAISDIGKVAIRTENCYIDETMPGYENKKEGDYAVLTVSDTGKGISPTDLDRIFEPFYTRKVMGRSGTGLGLAVVWGTVKDHDGYIEVKSEEAKGSIFTLFFPATRETLPTTERLVPRDKYLGRGECVLVVDDIEGQRILASSMLTDLGYEVHTVASGEEAVEFTKASPVDLLVLDMIMEPGIDGLETYERILKIRTGQKAIIVSGFSETERVRRAQELGAGAYVKKPYIQERIGLAIRKELDRL